MSFGICRWWSARCWNTACRFSGCARTTRLTTLSFVFGDVDKGLHPVLVATAVEVMIEEGPLTQQQYEFLQNLCTALDVSAPEFRDILEQSDEGLFQAAQG